MEQKHFELNKDFDHHIIKSLSIEELNLLSADIRQFIIQKCSENGGHLSSNLGIVELTIALFREFDFPQDKVIFDVGHQSYTYKILTGRPLDNLRKENGINGFQKRSESIYDCYEAGHSSTSISAAMGFALDRDLDGGNNNIIALIGDSSIANGMALEAVNNILSFNHKVIIVLNDNEMSIGKSAGAINNFLQRIRFSSHYIKTKQKYRSTLQKNKATSALYRLISRIKKGIKYHFTKLNFFENLGISYIPNVDGHDFKSLHHAFEMAKRAENSVVIHVSTTKGKGYAPAENDKEGIWHGVPPFDIDSGKLISSCPEGCTSWSSIYGQLLEEIMANNNKTVLVTPATVVGSALCNIMKKYPDRAYDVGIAEEHAVTLASGIASSGYHPYVSIYSTFLQRAYDQIQHDVARMNLPVTFLIDRAGLVGADGETHQGIFDASLLMSMPNIAVAMAKDASQAQQLMEFSIDYKKPLAIRYCRASTLSSQNLERTEKIELGQWNIEQQKKHDRIAVISYGPHLCELETLLSKDNVTIINAFFQKPINMAILEELIDYKHIFIYDPYGIKEGFSLQVQDSLINLDYKGKISIVALENAFVRCGTILQQEKRYGVDIDSFTQLLREYL